MIEINYVSIIILLLLIQFFQLHFRSFCCCAMNNSGRICFFGHSSSDIGRIQSNTDYEFQKYKLELTTFMQAVEKYIHAMDHFDLKNPKLLKVHDIFRYQVRQVPEYWEMNEILVRLLLKSSDLMLSISLPIRPCLIGLKRKYTEKSGYPSYNNLPQLFIHIARDWTDLGESVRTELYDKGIISLLIDNWPSSRTGETRLLLPGAGLGRLALTLAVAGYNVEANECSPPMILALHNMFREILPSGQQTSIFPTLTMPLMDEWDFSDRFEPQLFPSDDSIDLYHRFVHFTDANDSYDHTSRQSSSLSNDTDPADLLQLKTLSFQFGDFLDIYGDIHYSSYYDIVVTCYFLDTSLNILEYLAVIAHVLRAGGLWVNLGPLHYHGGGGTSIPYSAAQLREVVIATGFDLLSERMVSSDYCGESRYSMRPQIYNVPLTAWRLTRPADVIPLDTDFYPNDVYAGDTMKCDGLFEPLEQEDGTSGTAEEPIGRNLSRNNGQDRSQAANVNFILK